MPPPHAQKGQNKGHTRELILLREFVNNLCASFLGIVMLWLYDGWSSNC